jgi:hypothetical protein
MSIIKRAQAFLRFATVDLFLARFLERSWNLQKAHGLTIVYTVASNLKSNERYYGDSPKRKKRRWKPLLGVFLSVRVLSPAGGFFTARP